MILLRALSAIDISFGKVILPFAKISSSYQSGYDHAPGRNHPLIWFAVRTARV